MTKIIYFGNERLVSGLSHTNAPILRGLIERGHDIAAVVSHHAGSTSRNQRDLEVAKIAEEHGIPIFLPNSPSEIMDELRALDADIAVLAAYGRIISQQVIDIFPMGIVNIHPSLLPKYRGPTPIESAILNGDQETGVSIMQLTAGMDEGPIYAQRTVQIEGNEEKFHLYSEIVNVSTQLFFEVFPQIVDETLKPTPQDDTNATYSMLIQKSDGVIDWSKPAEQIEREIRAYAGWPQSRTRLGDIDVIVLDSTVIPTDIDTTPGKIEILYDENAKTLRVQTARGTLEINRVKPLGKKEMPITAFLTGYRSRLGA